MKRARRSMPFRTSLRNDGQLNGEHIVSFPGLRPDFALMGFHNGFGNGKAQAIAAVHSAGFVCPVESLENVLEKINDIDFYWHTLDASGKGLAYSGITLIPPTSMQKCIDVIENISELHQLKELLSKAYDENKWVIHFGI